MTDAMASDDETWNGTTVTAHTLAVDTGGGDLVDGDATEDQTDRRPLVTAVVTTYKRFERATEAIESVIQQTYRPFEVLVVEDGTDSGLEDWIGSQVNANVRYVRHEDNQGLSGARNTGIALAEGDYIAFLDDDDRWKPTRIERGIEVLRDRSAFSDSSFGVTYCAAESRKRGRLATVIRPENDGPLAASIRDIGPSTVESSCIFSRAALLDIGGYDESLLSSVDHDIWLALATGGYDAIAHDKPLVVTSIDFAGTMTTDTDARIAGVRQFIEKWRPTYHDWFGEAEGDRRLERYFAATIARLAAVKLVGGRVGEARRATRAVFAESDQHRYNVSVLGYATAESAAKRFLPSRCLRVLSRLAS